MNEELEEIIGILNSDQISPKIASRPNRNNTKAQTFKNKDLKSFNVNEKAQKQVKESENVAEKVKPIPTKNNDLAKIKSDATIQKKELQIKTDNIDLKNSVTEMDDASPTKKRNIEGKALKSKNNSPAKPNGPEIKAEVIEDAVEKKKLNRDLDHECNPSPELIKDIPVIRNNSESQIGKKEAVNPPPPILDVQKPSVSSVIAPVPAPLEIPMEAPMEDPLADPMEAPIEVPKVKSKEEEKEKKPILGIGGTVNKEVAKGIEKKYLVFRPYIDPIAVKPYKPPDRGYYFKFNN